MPAHLHDSRRRSVPGTWLSLTLSTVFDTATCRTPPDGITHSDWSMQWVSPSRRSDVVRAKELCRACPALSVCRELIDLAPDVPRGIVQAAIEFGCGPRTLSEGRAS